MRNGRFWLGYNLRLAAFSQNLPAFSFKAGNFQTETGSLLTASSARESGLRGIISQCVAGSLHRSAALGWLLRQGLSGRNGGSLLRWPCGGLRFLGRRAAIDSLRQQQMAVAKIVKSGKRLRTKMFAELQSYYLFEDCQSASDRDPRSASNRDPLVLRFGRLALAPSELVGVAETGRARVGV